MYSPISEWCIDNDLELSSEATALLEKWWEINDARGDAWRKQEAEAAAAKAAEEEAKAEEIKREREEKKAKLRARAARLSSLVKEPEKTSPVLVKKELSETNGAHIDSDDGEVQVVETESPKPGEKRLTKSERVVRENDDIVSGSSFLFRAY